MQSSSIVSGVPFRKEPRAGQRQAFSHALLGQRLNLKLPTGYGKTFTACGIYSIRQHHQMATRLLYVVPTRAQLDQLESSAPKNFHDCSVVGPRNVAFIGSFADHDLLKRHRTNTAQIFAATIQYLCQGGFNICRDLLETGQWMICIDEYHHYGLEKAWGQRIKQFPHTFLLAMSATPYRSTDDSAFGVPDVVVTYRKGVGENAIKPLVGHAYDYRIDAVDENGEITTYTTAELVEEAGGDSAEKIERMRIKRKMRWSPKYVSPLIDIPITRMQAHRTDTGRRLQALVTAMCVSHAELVCGQIKGMFPNLKVDWIGTGTNGRSDEENAKILADFCPPERYDGTERPEPKLDVLVHVGMAGEGLDTVNVSEVVLLRPASFNNQTNQIVGRASRFLADVDGRPIEANISFDGSTEFARGMKVNGSIIKATGSAIIDAMDLEPAAEKPSEGDDGDDDSDFPPELPIEPSIQIRHMELERIDSGDSGVQFMADVINADNPQYLTDYAAMKADSDHPDWLNVIELYRMMRAKEADQFNERAIVAQWQDSVESAVSAVTGIAVALMRTSGLRVERTLIGDIKKRINTRKKSSCGAVEPNKEVCMLHWNWLKALEKELRDTRRIPSWLA